MAWSVRFRCTKRVLVSDPKGVVVSHANPRWLKDTARNVSKPLLKALAAHGGLLGLSLYPAHLPAESATTLQAFGDMAAQAAEIIGVERLGVGSDLCRHQPDSVVRWMREGRWTRPSPDSIVFPEQPAWFQSSADFPRLAEGLAAAGFRERDMEWVLGGAWAAYLKNLRPA